jgi:hypothetical protein
VTSISPATGRSEQSGGQLIPAGELVTVPVPGPTRATDRVGPPPDGGDRTVTVKEHVAVLPAASVAVAVTVVVPKGKVLPDAGTATTVTPGALSVATTVNVTTAPPGEVP